MKLFKVMTDQKSSIIVSAKSEFHARKVFKAKFERFLGKPTRILDITPRSKNPAIKLTASGRELS